MMGIFDSGLGGLITLKSLIKALAPTLKRSQKGFLEEKLK